MDNNKNEERIIANEGLEEVAGGISVHNPSQHIYDMKEGLSYDKKDSRAGFESAMNKK